jgi:GrpB-like predicted nucleotidyltransferase (UPF0157 family)
MTESREAPDEPVKIVDYDPGWPGAYAAERSRLLAVAGAAFERLEHIGSTSVPGLAAKPVIDMMAAVPSLGAAEGVLPGLAVLGYGVVKTGMRGRLLLVRRAPGGLRYHLHLVETASWADRKERHMRDYLRAHPAEAAAYGALKRRLADAHRDDPVGYTEAKTGFLQRASDAMRDGMGLPRIDVWEE